MSFIGQLHDADEDGFDFLFYSASITLLLVQIQKHFNWRLLNKLNNYSDLEVLRQLIVVQTPDQLSEWLKEHYPNIQFRILNGEGSLVWTSESLQYSL